MSANILINKRYCVHGSNKWLKFLFPISALYFKDNKKFWLEPFNKLSIGE